MLTRTDRRRFPILPAVIAALAMAMLFSPVQAQEGSAPDQPTGLEATATQGQVVLTWDDPPGRLHHRLRGPAPRPRERYRGRLRCAGGGHRNGGTDLH